MEYSDDVPVFALRLLPALCGALISPSVYLILCELGVSKWTGALAGILLLLGKYSAVNDNLVVSFVSLSCFKTHLLSKINGLFEHLFF